MKNVKLTGKYKPETNQIFFETEPNDSKDTADDLTNFLNYKKPGNNVMISGDLSDASDVDYFKFTLKQGRMLKIPNDTLDSFTLENESGNEVQFEPLPLGSYYSKAKLPKGTYYFKFTDSSITANQVYFLSFYIELNEFDEEEESSGALNDTFDTATDLTDFLKKNGVIQLNGLFEGVSNTDYYSFQVTNELTHLKLNFDSYDYDEIELFDANKEKVDYYFNENYRELFATLESGIYYLKLVKNNPNDVNYYVTFEIEPITPPVKAGDVKIYNNIDTDIVVINNLVAGRQYKLNWENGTKIFKANANKKKEKISVDPLKTEGGFMTIEVYDEKTGWNSTRIKYEAEPKEYTPSVNANKVIVKNNINKPDEITFDGILEQDTEYFIYLDKAKNDELYSFTADQNKTKTIALPQNLNNAGGSLYITAKKKGYSESLPVEIKYSAEWKTED